MAYNTSKGPRDLGDIKNEDDTDTQIDFGSDQIAFKTNNAERLQITNLHVSCSVPLSASSLNVDNYVFVGNLKTIGRDDGVIRRANIQFADVGPGSIPAVVLRNGGSDLMVVNSSNISSSLNLSASAFYGDGSTLSNVGAGTMSSWTLSADGGSNQTIMNSDTVDIAGGTGITTAASATDTVTINLDNTTVTAASYTNADITVDAQGRITAASNGTAGGMSSFTLAGDGGSSQAITNGNTLTVAGGTGLTSTAGATDTVTVALDNTSVSAGSYTYSSVTVDAQGRLTAAGNGVAPSITTLNNPGSNRVITSDGGAAASGEPNLTFDGSKLTVAGEVSSSLGVTGSTLVAAGGILRLSNDSGNSKIETSMNHLILRNSVANKHVRVRLGDDAGITQFQIRNNSNAKVAEITSTGHTEVNQLTASAGVQLTGSLKVIGSQHAKYNYRTTAGTYSVVGDDNVVIFNNAGASTAVLPGIAWDNKGIQYTIKNRGGGNVVITGSSGLHQLIDGALTFTVGSSQAVKVMAVKPPTGPYEWVLIGKFQ